MEEKNTEVIMKKKSCSDLTSNWLGGQEKERAKYYCVTWKKHGSNVKTGKVRKKSCLGGVDKFS